MVNAALSVVALTALAASTANAHGVINKPGLKFTGTAYGGDFSSLVPMTALKPVGGNKFTHYPDATLNANAFGDAFKASEYKSLKEFILKNQDMSKGRKKNPSTPECGFTDPTSGPVQTLPDQIEWYGGQMNHPGPCEAWCDDELVLPFEHNCQAKYPNGKFPYDKSKCVGKNRLTFYWMSTLLEWQVYIDCAKIGNGSPSSSSGSSKPTAAPAPAKNTTKPSTTPATTTKPSAVPATPTKPTTAPVSPAKPSSAPASTAKPSATTKCKVRRA